MWRSEETAAIIHSYWMTEEGEEGVGTEMPRGQRIRLRIQHEHEHISHIHVGAKEKRLRK